MQMLRQLLRKQNPGLSAETLDVAVHIQKGAEGMARLITSLLQYAQAGQGEIKRQRVSADTMVDAVRNSLAPVITETNARILSGGLPTIDADPVLLERVF